jgi:DNA-binding response OmpR family regulator
MAYFLVVDNDEKTLHTIKIVLKDQGHTFLLARSGSNALHLLAAMYFDLCIVDLIMPDMNGLSLIRQTRRMPHLARMPILILTASGHASDVVKGLDAGADDFLRKPFEIVQLPARVRALLRRRPGGMLDTSSDKLWLGNLCLHITRYEVWIDDKPVELTAREHQLLYYLLRHPGQPISTQRLLEDIWGCPPGVGNPNLVRVHITNLQSKLAAISGRHYIHDVRGQGYMISP